MGNIVMTRVDYRMIHGQVAGTWIPALSCDRVIIIDDATAKDELVIEIMRLGAPHGIKVDAYTVEEAIQSYQADSFGDGTIIVLFRDVATAYRTYSAGFDFKALNVGQTPRTGDQKHATATVFLTNQDLNDLKSLEDRGVEVYFHQTLTVPRVELSSVYSKLKK